MICTILRTTGRCCAILILPEAGGSNISGERLIMHLFARAVATHRAAYEAVNAFMRQRGRRDRGTCSQADLCAFAFDAVLPVLAIDLSDPEVSCVEAMLPLWLMACDSCMRRLHRLVRKDHRLRMAIARLRL